MLLTDWIFFLFQTRLHSSRFIFCLFPITAFFCLGFVFSFTFSNSFLLTFVFLLFFHFFFHCIVEFFPYILKLFLFLLHQTLIAFLLNAHTTPKEIKQRKKGKKDLASSNPGMQVVMPHPVSTYPYPHRQTDWWVGGGGVTKWRRTPTYHILTSHNSSCYL